MCRRLVEIKRRREARVRALEHLAPRRDLVADDRPPCRIARIRKHILVDAETIEQFGVELRLDPTRRLRLRNRPRPARLDRLTTP
jgi:hypothetical protein